MSPSDNGPSFKIVWWVLIIVVLIVFFGFLSGGLSIFFDPSPETNSEASISRKTVFCFE